MTKDSICEFIAAISVFSFVLLCLFGGIWWEVYKYTDCRKVGHSFMYCVFKDKN